MYKGRGFVCAADRRAITAATVAVLVLCCAKSECLASSTVAITSPANGSSVSGQVTVVVALGSGVWSAKLYVDGAGKHQHRRLLAKAAGKARSAVASPYNFSWNSTSVENGTYTLSVSAFAKGGTTPLATSSISVAVANSSSESTGYFSTLAPHAPLPSDSQCAALVASTPETIPANAPYNSASAIPTASELTGVHTAPVYNDTWVPAADFARVDGNFSGSTDMILRWAACKWGIDESVTRAEAWVESGWKQDDNGDWRTSLADCERGNWDGWNGSGCWQSWGILSVKLFDFNTYPEAVNSTAFNADFRMAYQRACMNGDISYLADQTPLSGYPTYPNGNTAQMLWGCMGDWYSGNWYDSAALGYIAQVQGYLASEPWAQ